MAGPVEAAEGVGSLLVSFAGMTAAAMTPFPAEIAAIAVAMRHGFWLGLGVIWLGAMTGAWLCYAVARRSAGRIGWLDRSPGVRRAREKLVEMDWIGILGLRLIPLVPFFALSLAAGLLALPLGPFLRGTALGILPAAALLAALGQGMIGKSAQMMAAGALGLAALTLLGLLVRRAPHGRRKALPRRADLP